MMEWRGDGDTEGPTPRVAVKGGGMEMEQIRRRGAAAGIVGKVQKRGQK